MSAGRRRAAYITTGTSATPVWAQMTRISDVKRPKSRGTSDRKYRGAANVKTVTGYIKYGFTFKYHLKGPRLSSDAILTLLEASLQDETMMDVIFLDQRITQPTGTFTAGATAKGVRGPVVCVKLDLDEADEDGNSYDVELVEIEDEQASVLTEVAAFSIAVVAG